MNNNQKIPTQKPLNWTRLLWYLLVGILIINIFRMLTPPNYLELSYSDFKNQVDQGKISQITIKGDKIMGSFKQPMRQSSEGKASGQEAIKKEGAARSC